MWAHQSYNKFKVSLDYLRSFYSLQDNIVYTDWKQDNFFRAVAEELGPTKGIVGVEDDHLTLEKQHKLLHHLSGGPTLTDVSMATMRMRMIKSQEEIAVIKVALLAFTSLTFYLHRTCL